jgi:DHA2 family multidrug resistance protein
MLAIGSWIQTGLTHDWVSGDFIVSQLIEAVGLAFAVTSVIAFAAANVTPALAAAIATTIQIARWLGTEIGSVVMQTFVLPEATSGRGYVRNGDAS